MEEAIERQAQVGLDGEREGAVQHHYARQEMPVERQVVEIPVLCTSPSTHKRQAGVQPLARLEGHGSLHTRLLQEIEVHRTVYLQQFPGRLVERLHGVILVVIEPGGEDVLRLQHVVQRDLVKFRGLQERVALYLGIATAQVGHGILHLPIGGIALVAVEAQLEDMPLRRQVRQVEDGIHIPLIPHGRLIPLPSQRSVQHPLLSEVLIETRVKVQRLLPPP